MSIRADIMQYFEKHPNEKTYLNELTDELGHEDTRPVQSGIYAVIRNNLLPGVETVVRGQCWIYKPDSTLTGGHSMRVIGETQKGSRILEDEESVLWIARKFED